MTKVRAGACPGSLHIVHFGSGVIAITKENGMSRTHVSVLALALSAAAFGAAVAKEPPDGPGGARIEYTSYDANGIAIGGRWKDCTGHIAIGAPRAARARK